MENLMQDKQLNFYQPLLSVRRGSSTTLGNVDRSKPINTSPSIPPLPYYKSELKSGPMIKPGAIPFQWEQIPGRPKDERKMQNKFPVRPPPAPKPPPGRLVCNDENSPDKLSKDLQGSKSQRGYDAASVSDSSSLYKNAGEFEQSEDDREENGSSLSDDENSTYLDALDTLSRSESFFLNCSLSGVSGLDGPGIKPAGTFSDPHTRDFMMGRFLPAAKAVASETPHLGSRKQPVVKEQPREVKKPITLDKQTPQNYRTPIYLPQHREDEREQEDVDTEDEVEEEDQYGGTENVSNKLCGLLPQFCLLNLISGMRDQAPTPVPSVRKAQKKHSNSGIYNKSEKAIRHAISERRRLTVYQRSDMRVDAGDLEDELRKLKHQNASLKLDELSKIATLASNNIAPYRSVSRHSLMDKEKGFLGFPEAAKRSGATKLNAQTTKGFKIFRELLAKETAEEESPLANPTIEKTLYVDSAQIEEYPDSNYSSSESKSDSRGRTPSIDYSLQDIKDVCFENEKKLSQSRNLDDSDHKKVRPSQGVQKQELEKEDNGFPQFEDHKQDFLNSGDLKLQGSRLSDADVQQLPRKEEKADRNPLLPPPLPKSPSESWLSRALPSLSSKHPHPKSYISTKSLALKPLPAECKWEAVVKCSSLHTDNAGLPALMPISEN